VPQAILLDRNLKTKATSPPKLVNVDHVRRHHYKRISRNSSSQVWEARMKFSERHKSHPRPQVSIGRHSMPTRLKTTSWVPITPAHLLNQCLGLILHRPVCCLINYGA
jgi:hypothetical protein